MTLLNSPIKVGTLELKNRLVMPPMATEKSESDGSVRPELIKYYREKAHGGYIGLIIMEYSYVNQAGKASARQLSMAEDADMEGLKKLTDAIHSEGSKVFAQINHAGAAAKSSVTNKHAYGPSTDPMPEHVHTFQGLVADMELTKEQIEEIIEDFTKAALRAKEAGFDGVEIHAAHGYLLDQFYSPLVNHRDDEYNGHSIEGRVKLHKEIIRSVRKAVGPTYPLSMRFGSCDYIEGGATIEDGVKAAKILEDAGLDLLDISGGIQGYVNPKDKSPGYFKEASSAIKKVVSIPVILTGGVKEKESAEKLLEEGAADLIGVGRAIAKDPMWAQKAMGN